MTIPTLFGATLIASVAPLALAPTSPAEVPPPPPKPSLVTWKATDVTCGGSAVAFQQAPEPLPGLSFLRALGPEPSKPLRFTFSIAADGRVKDVKPAEPAFAPEATDVVPALLASRFAAGTVRSGCSLTFVRDAAPIDSADLEDLIAYTVFPSGRPPQPVWDRIKPAGSDCLDNAPAPRTRVFPDFPRIPQAPGTLAWTLVGYDLDESGRTSNIRPVATTGNKVLEGAATDAISRSTFEPGRRSGCLYPYWRRGGIVPAPDGRELSTYRRADATCPDQLDWARPPVLNFPEPFRRRGIEGWAVVAYDVAPWGEIGNVKLLEAQPASAFGDAGMRVIRSAAKVSGKTGYIGCVDRVRFVMGARGSDRVGAEGPVAPPIL